MAGLNKCFIIGNLGRDPEVTYTQSGTAVAKITVATSETWNDKQTGEKKEKTEWHRITFFGKHAETVGKYLSKGKQVYVEGKLQTTQYEKDGITRYSTDIIASEFKFLGGRDQQQGHQGYPQNQGGFQTHGSGQNPNYGQQQNINSGGFQPNRPQQDTPSFQVPALDDEPF